MTTLTRSWVEPLRNDARCERCKSDPPERHAFRVLLKAEEGPSWWVDVTAAIGPNDAREQARSKAHDEGEIDVGVIQIAHVPAPALDDEEEPDPIDTWKAYRDAGYSEPQLRALSGDR